MRKYAIFLLSVFIVIIFATSSFASSRWEQFIEKTLEYEKIEELGKPMIDNLRKDSLQAEEIELWRHLWEGSAQDRVKAGLSLMDRVFPDGDPSRWQEASGFLSNTSRLPRQLAAIDALFVTIDSLNELPEGVWASAYLLNKFGKSTRGRMYFIDDTTPEVRKIVDNVIEKTKLKGDWSSKVIRGKAPFLPRHNGYISTSRAIDKRMIFLNGYGSIAGNGNYSWDRENGYLYEIISQTGVVSPQR